MTQLFDSKSNYIFRGIIIGGTIFLITAAGSAAYFIQRSSYSSGVGIVMEQDIPFSHEHHVKGLGIDCRFCHTSVEKSPFAGMPATETCMKCHSKIWNDSPMLEPVRESFRTGQPLVWNRVYDLPDFVYFDHSVHIQKGVSCQTCHGDVGNMPLTRKETTLHMSWCLRCHEHPGSYVKPEPPFAESGYFSHEAGNAETTLASKEQKGWKKWNLGMEKERIQQIQNCSACHR